MSIPTRPTTHAVLSPTPIRNGPFPPDPPLMLCTVCPQSSAVYQVASLMLQQQCVARGNSKGLLFSAGSRAAALTLPPTLDRHMVPPRG